MEAQCLRMAPSIYGVFVWLGFLFLGVFGSLALEIQRTITNGCKMAFER